MQFNLVNNEEMLVFTCIWSDVGSVVRPSFFFLTVLSVSIFSYFFNLPRSTTPPFFPLLSQCHRCLHVTVWGFIAGLQGLLALRVFYCLELVDHSGGPWISQAPPFWSSLNSDKTRISILRAIPDL